jgi:peptidyl-prolyl cis-trans isomerase C
MKKFLFFIIAMSIFTIIFIGCSKSSKSDGPVIAKVNKEPITEEEFLYEISRIPDWARSQFSGEEGKKKFLEELIKRELIFQYAKKMKLDRDEEYLQRLEDFKKRMLVSLVLKKEVEEKAVVEEEEIKNYYEQNADKFTIGTKIRASHILVDTEQEAKEIIEKLNKGESFSKLAKSFSKDKGSAEKGGDLGYFGRGQMVPEFERAVLGLKPGEISEPVRTRFGYHIIKLVDIKKGTPASFEQSKESIRRQLLTEKRKRLFDSFINKLMRKGDIVKDEVALAGVSLPWEEKETKPAEKDIESEAVQEQQQPETE